ncbi:TadE/TadG family type IV pilus assembly protein [Neorhizobium alkalisoli]|uniref:Flp pilus assembly protein TadG n=1 Tax=Neorhizobium alkalisoli TaxID=528178 RepID=A0A561QH98_9HYPH|nr:TadE/TadG family type IV pilus assembly protein [Neorhizobium alkalisoli]TWF49727.1 Flp pilus assembly protein TadG [Neorhizobium alkalisoli]
MRRLTGDRRGNFGIMTALLLVPLAGAAGMALDFSRAMTVKSQLFAAADAAAVGAISEKSKAVAQAMAMSGNGNVSLDPTEARNIFFGQMSNDLSDVTVNVDITVAKVNGVITSHVTFDAAMPTTFMQVLGQTQIALSDTATAQYQTPSFQDFFMLLDNTPSMGVGATPTDVANMKKATANGYQGPGPNKGGDADCAFACHIVSTDGVDDPYSYYNVAKAKGITTRIDVVASATKALMATATSTQTTADQFRVAAYTFGQTAMDAKLYKVAALSYSLSDVAKATDKITLMSIPYQNYNNDQQTSFDDALKGINTEIAGTPGKGTSNADRAKIVFFVADGVADAYKPVGCTSPKGANNGRCIEPVDTTTCTTLKNRGIKIAVLYTTYLPLLDNNFYKSWVAPFQPTIASKMKECATDGLYFEVSPTEGIDDAMKTLFLKIVSMPRITS